MCRVFAFQISSSFYYYTVSYYSPRFMSNTISLKLEDTKPKKKIWITLPKISRNFPRKTHKEKSEDCLIID